jgi:hypothetical protein
VPTFNGPTPTQASKAGLATHGTPSAQKLFRWSLVWTACAAATSLLADPTPLPTPRPVQSVTRDDGWTGSLPGIEPNPHKTFNPDAARASNRSFPGLKNGSAKSFSLLRPFGGSRQVVTPSYPLRDFLPKAAPDSSKSFPSTTFLSSTQSAPTLSFSAPTSGSAFGPKTSPSHANSQAPQANLRVEPATSPSASRSFESQEANRMKLQFPPGGAPNSGVIQGHRLSVEELRALLNTSK